jgi:hypothetical protein
MRPHVSLALLVFSAALLSGCNDYELSGTEHTEMFILDPSSEVDILFVVDDSPSMKQEHDKVKDAFEEFIYEVNAGDTDWQIGVTTTDMEGNEGGVLLGPGPLFITPETENYPGVFLTKIDTVGTQGSGWEQGLQATRRALLDSPIGLADSANAGFLRPDADLAIVVVSDENDCSDGGALPHEDQLECYQMNELLVPTAEFVHALDGLKDESAALTFSAIVGPPNAEECESATPGHRYLSLVSEFEGLQADICEDDYETVMADLGLLATGVQSFFVLQWTPDPETIEVRIDGVDVPEDPAELDGWSYRADENTVYLWGSHTPPRGSTVEIHYWTHK